MVTPFKEDGTIDANSVARLVNHIIDAGTYPFIIGTTGESASISAKEKTRLVKETIKATNNRTLVYAGISGNCLEESIADAKTYSDLGVDVVVATMPYYYPVDEKQMLKYFVALADSIPCPLVVYNIPSTTHLSIPIAVADQLSRHDNIVGFKDSEKGVERIDAATAFWKDRQDFSYLLGWAQQSLYAMSLGADGIIPSTGNLAPTLYKTIIDAVLNGDLSKAQRAQDKAELVSQHYQNGRTLNHSLPALKAMLSAYGLCGPAMLPPLYRMEAAEEKALVETCRSSFGDLQQVNSID